MHRFAEIGKQNKGLSRDKVGSAFTVTHPAPAAAGWLKTSGTAVLALSVFLLAPGVYATNPTESAQNTPNEHWLTFEAKTRREAALASKGRIVLHFGDDTKGAPMMAEILKERGYPTIAYSGGKSGEVEIFIHRKIIGTFSQWELDDGTVGGTAIRFYNREFRSHTSP